MHLPVYHIPACSISTRSHRLMTVSATPKRTSGSPGPSNSTRRPSTARGSLQPICKEPASAGPILLPTDLNEPCLWCHAQAHPQPCGPESSAQLLLSLAAARTACDALHGPEQGSLQISGRDSARPRPARCRSVAVSRGRGGRRVELLWAPESAVRFGVAEDGHQPVRPS